VRSVDMRRFEKGLLERVTQRGLSHRSAVEADFGAVIDTGDEVVDHYWRTLARENHHRGGSVVYVVDGDAKGALKGFFTLSANSLEREHVQAILNRPPKQVPVLLLGMFGLNKSSQGRGEGKLLLAQALVQALIGMVQVGALGVVVQPSGPKARSFWEKFGFLAIPGERMFLTRDQIVMNLDEVEELP
jgi:hypothetical protein